MGSERCQNTGDPTLSAVPGTQPVQTQMEHCCCSANVLLTLLFRHYRDEWVCRYIYLCVCLCPLGLTVLIFFTLVKIPLTLKYYTLIVQLQQIKHLVPHLTLHNHDKSSSNAG